MRDPLDTKIRELTYRLVHMAPEAPPFPETSMATLTPEKPHIEDRPRRRTVAAWVAAAAFAVVLLVGIPLMLLRGGEEPVATTPPSSTVTTVPSSTTMPVEAHTFDVSVYFLADYVEESASVGPHLVPVQRRVEVATAGEPDVSDEILGAINGLLAGPDPADPTPGAEVSSAIPTGTDLLGVLVDQTGDVPRVVLDFNNVFESGGGTFSMGARLAQVVYTATQFDGIDAVEITLEGQPVDVFSSEGLVLDGPLTRDGYRDILPPIFVESPTAGATVTSPIEISGVANTFEAGLESRVELADGTLLADGFATASCGTGCWGVFDFTVQYALEAQSAGSIVVFETSARDGSPVNVVRIPVILEPAEGSTEGQYTEAYGVYPDGTPFAAPLNGAVVVESPITIYGFTNATTELVVDGEPVPVTEENFEFSFDLEPGINEILLEDGVLDTVFTVTYLPGGERLFGFVAGGVTDESGMIEGPDGTLYTTPVLLAVDDAQWLSGDAANQAAFEDGVIGSVEEGVPNDYYIRNQDAALLSIPVRPDVGVYLVDVDTMLPARVDLATWLELVDVGGDGSHFNAGSPEVPYWFVLDAEGYIVQVVQQYIP